MDGRQDRHCDNVCLGDFLSWCLLLVSGDRSQSSLVAKLTERGFMTVEFFWEVLFLCR